MSQHVSTAQPSPDNPFEVSLRGLIGSHRWLALAVAAACAVLVAMLASAVFGSKAGAVTDATTCSQWGSASQSRQAAYARLYIKEHGPVAAAWGPPDQGVINAINAGCTMAFGEDVSDTATVVQAISRSF